MPPRTTATRHAEPNDCSPRDSRAATPAFEPTVTLTDVGFDFPGGSHSLLRGITLVVASGSSLALVGPTGAGKTTIADLALGLLPPGHGIVAVGGLRRPRRSRRGRGNRIRTAGRDRRERIHPGQCRAWAPSGSHPRRTVWEALDRAYLADFLRSRREGLDTIVGEARASLERGQRQRLGLARALYTRPRLLVLDEATSALDSSTEKSISDTLESIRVK